MTIPFAPGFPSVDSISINGVPAPGQWILQPCQKVFGWQIQQGYALSGATVFPKGDELVVAPFLIRLWDPADYPLFVEFAARFLKKPVFSIGLTTFAIGLYHPELIRLGVRAVVVQKEPALTNNGKGLWTGTAEFLQYRKPVIAAGKPKAAIPAAAQLPNAPLSADAQQHARAQSLINARGP
jgi:hypothetical protein